MSEPTYTPVVVCPDRLAMVQGVHLRRGWGSGITPNDPEHCEVCIEQLANAVACSWRGDRLVPAYELKHLNSLGDTNPSICRIIRVLRMTVNDKCPDKLRDELLWPTLLPAFNTCGSRALTTRRMFRVVDWAVREILPLSFDAAELPSEAAELRALAVVTDVDTAHMACEVVRRVSESIYVVSIRQKIMPYAAAIQAALRVVTCVTDVEFYKVIDAQSWIVDSIARCAVDVAYNTAILTAIHAIHAADTDDIWRLVTSLILELCAMKEDTP